MIRTIRIWLAVRRLNRLVAKQRASFECQQYRKHRNASKLGWQRRRAGV